MLNECLTYLPDFISSEQTAVYFNFLKHNIYWQQEILKIYGREVKTPRLTAFYGDEGVNYKYSGKKFFAQIWNRELRELKEKTEEATSNKYNCVLLNFYRDGNDSMGWHSDDEKELGTNPIIASVNLGEARRFDFRNKNKHQLKHSIVLQNGSLLLMKGDIQHNWQHQIAKTKRQIGERINLTFRQIGQDS